MAQHGGAATDHSGIREVDAFDGGAVADRIHLTSRRGGGDGVGGVGNTSERGVVANGQAVFSVSSIADVDTDCGGEGAGG